MTHSQRSKFPDWDQHYGHRLTAEPVERDSRGTGACVVCLDCGVRLAHRDDPATPDRSETPDPLASELVQLVAELRSMLHDERFAGRAVTKPLTVPGYPALTLPTLQSDPYWSGYSAGCGQCRELIVATLCQQIEVALARHTPAPDRETAWLFVRGAVERQWLALRNRSNPGGRGDSDPPVPFIATDEKNAPVT